MQERNITEFVCHVCEVPLVVIRVSIPLMNRVLPIPAIDKPGGVCEEMLYRHFGFRVNNSRATLRVNLHVFESGNQFRDRGAELEMSFLVEHHHCDTGNRLRH